VVGDADAATAVTLVFPPQPRLVRMARLASSALATVAGADVDTIDDIKIAVDEVCASLIEAGDGSDVKVGFTVEGDRFEIVGETTGALDLDRERFELSRQILLAVAERHELTTTNGDVRFAVICSLQSGRDGAR
jgi:serine/threonine-protein kinase RsbW